MNDKNDNQHPNPSNALAIHASAVRTSSGALLFLGPSGTGKSTMCHFLSDHTQTLALDAVYLAPQANGWKVVKGDGRAHKRSLPEREAVTLEGAPLRAILRLYQAPTPLLKPVSPLETCRYLTDALFEIVRQREDDLDVKRHAFSKLAVIARSVPGYQFHSDLSPQALEMLNEEVGLWGNPKYKYSEPADHLLGS